MTAGPVERAGMPLLVAVLAVGSCLGGLLVGYEPVGGDPDRIFRPIKSELARSLGQGRLPFWSERFGLGVPLVAESHVAAYYPPNLALYGVLEVSTAYRLAMWGHYAALVAATFAYARRLGIGPWGSAMAAVSFALCGFLTIHSSHEWAYQTLAYLPLCLLAADGFAGSGRPAWLAALGLAWGCQITIGHFQVQMWTGGLALLTGGWRVIAEGRPLRRLAGLAVGLAWGGAVAAAQLVPTWELAQLVGQTRRSFAELAFYSYPPGHWPELAIPGLFRWLRGGPEAAYWFGQQTTGYEACLFVGTVPLILAWVGLVGGGRDRALDPWRLIVPASLALATMPRWWPAGYAAVLQLPGPGYFRCPARYTAITSLGLALLAGRGLDRAISGRRFGIGLALASATGLGAVGLALAWFSRHGSRATLDQAELAYRLGLAGLAWALGLGSVLLWRWGRLGGWAPVLLTAAEMAALFHSGTTRWGWSVPLPQASPVLSFLARQPGVGRVEGPLDNLAVRAGLETATPYLGFPLPPPHRLLGAATDPANRDDPAAVRWLGRFGVTHAVRDGPGAARDGQVLFRGLDPALDRLANRPAGSPLGRDWRVVRLPDPIPAARVALRVSEAPDRTALIVALSRSDSADHARSLPEARPPEGRGPRARSARVLHWEGTSGQVEHDGECDLILSRAFYPGWVASVDDGPERPAWPADGGLLAVRLEGQGVSRVRIRFRPTRRGPAALTSGVAVGAALVVLGFSRIRRREQASGPSPGLSDSSR
jgi:hypothetical protein